MTSRLIGRKKGQLTVKGIHSASHTKTGNLRRNLRTECSCGATYIINEANFAKSKHPACSVCRKANQMTKREAVSDHPLRARWHGMIARCYKPENDSYKNYGARGISVCQRWLDSFEAYVTDVGLPPFTAASLDRINNDGDYEPSNVRWSTPKQQSRNTRVARQYNRSSLAEIEEKHGLQIGCCSRIAKKLDLPLEAIANALVRNHSIGDRCYWLKWLGIARKTRVYHQSDLTELEGLSDELEKNPQLFLIV